ncbi:MAG: S8 family serine peptidase [Wenzhouxiangellaceae bacterium]
MMFHQKKLAIAVSLAVTAFAATAQAEDGRYIVKFKDQRGVEGSQALRAAGGQVVLNLNRHRAAAAMLSERAVAALQKNPNIEYIEKDVKRYPLSLRNSETAPYGIAAVQADQASFQGGIKVCIIDSGYDLGHPDNQNNANISGADTGAGPWFQDGLGHGTHVAGTIAAIGGNGVGVVGVLPDANVQLHIVRAFNDGGGFVYASGLVGALDECEAWGADVVNMSLGSSQKSRTEDRAFADAETAGVLSIAAAGNDGNTRHSYPASYDSVISVAAIDEQLQHADFSQRTSQVELSGPGVHVLSTVPENTGSEASASVGASSFIGDAMDGSPAGSASGALVDCGLGTSACAGASGAVCLIERGDVSFAEKVVACESGGGSAAIVYNNVAGPLLGTLGGEITGIPSIGISQADGQAMLNQLGQNTTVTVEVSDYAFFDGTSMATPHVAGVAALVWSHSPTCTNTQIRAVLGATAMDLDVAGRDDSTGFGLVQAKDAIDFIAANGCDGAGNGGGGGGNGGGNGGGPRPRGG